jgi:CheY-like chemotaxis protein
MAKILIVDDDDAVRQAIRVVLGEATHEVTDTKSGRKALDLIEKDSYDLLILDLLMPETDGLEVIRAVRKNGGTVKILAISGGGNVSPDMYLKLAEKFGANSTLRKPFGKTDLLDAVAALLEAC